MEEDIPDKASNSNLRSVKYGEPRARMRGETFD